MKHDYAMQLVHHLELEYDLSVQQILPAKRGFFGETWKIKTDKSDYFVKIDYWEYHKQSYQNSLSVIQYLTDCGIAFVPKIIKTKKGALFCYFRKGVVAVSEYVKGENREDYTVEQLFDCLAQIYKLKCGNMQVKVESFGEQIVTDFNQLRDAVSFSPAITQAIEQKSAMISSYAERLNHLSEICCRDLSNFHITHGDAGGNCIWNVEQFFVVDWDSVKLAPIERDAWFFICNSNQLLTINDVIQKYKLCYTLKQERLCYYCYYSFFYYLTEYLKSFLWARRDRQKQYISESLIKYLTQSWIYKRLGTADLFDGKSEEHSLKNQKNVIVWGGNEDE